jgi:16S rRNA (cytosine967-C5)-methyltransferase
MSISPARVAAFEILLRVERTEAFASELLHSSRYAKLSSVDHGLATELVMGVLRWRSLLDAQITKLSSQPLSKIDLEVLTALRMAAYQLGFLSRVPQHAAVHESVELVKQAKKQSAVGFTNAVLRKVSGCTWTNPTAPEDADQLAADSAHPAWLVDRWMRDFGWKATQEICAYDQLIPQTTIRCSDPTLETELARAGIELASGNLLASARRVLSAGITRTKAFRDGRVAIQDEGSQLVGLLVGQGKRILDCCAAPGGKTRVLAEQNPQTSVVAVELHPHRARLLRRLVSAKNVEVVTSDVRQLRVSEPFDCVLADVPCSGTGTLAHNPEIKWRLKSEDLADLHSRQLTILQAAMRRVGSGGRLVYSTCSLEHEESSDVVTEALANNNSFRLMDCKTVLESLQTRGELVWKDIQSLVDGPYLRTLPGIHPCDGFFAAIIEKS